MKPIKLIVIGGGIAGLSAAYYAQKRALAKDIPLELTVLEADDHWGGKITTDRVENFVIEGGPDTFLAAKPWGVALCKELGLAERLHGTNPRQRNTYVLHRNRLEPLPDGLAMMIPGKVGPMITTRLLTWPQKARLGLDFFIPPHANDADETLGGFISRRLGRACYENLIEPLMSGIYAGDGDQLSLLATFPYLRDMERKYHSLAWGAMSMYRQRLRAQRQSGSRSVFLTPTTGLAEIVEALAAYLKEHGADLRLKTKTSQLESFQVATFKPVGLPTFQHGWDVVLDTEERLQADAVILATPAYVSGKLLASLDPELGSVLESIPYVSTATVSLAYRQDDLPRPLDGYGYVIPRREGRRALACTWTSTKFPHRAPDGYALLRIFVGRAGQEDDIAWNDDYLLDIAREELRLTLGITAEPFLTRVFIWEKAMPQYNLGHPEKLAQIDAALTKYPGLALAGNGYRGIGIPDCIHSGEEAAKKLVRKDIVDALS
ncbi:MAG: protoporphyrinogen oxidase [Chloroflexi bacterium]|nr:protoporphyrinogen oxidase [Chloroflexota bacterium]